MARGAPKARPPVDQREASEKPYRVYFKQRFDAEPGLMAGFDSQADADACADQYRSEGCWGRVTVEKD